MKALTHCLNSTPRSVFPKACITAAAVNRTESRAVDAIEIFVATLDSTVTRQNIVTAMRKLRKTQKEALRNATQD